MTTPGIETRSVPSLYVVVPCYNEEEALPATAARLRDTMRQLVEDGKVAPSSRVLLVDDGSADGTWEVVRNLHDNPENEDLFLGISLAHNRGHQNALYAGLMEALGHGCDAAVSIDADLQDDPDAIGDMVDAYLAGAEVVYGVRDDRQTDTRFKRGTAHAFYRIMRILGAELVPDSADFRLMGSAALRALSGYEETNLFLRGIVPSLGFKAKKVYYKRGVRVAGESKYPLRKMVAFAVDGITSFSVVPLRLVTAVGGLFVFVALAMLVYAVASLIHGSAVSGWTSLMVSIWLVGGVLMVSLGVVGEYVGKIYLESKRRPRYVIAERLE